MKSFLRNTVLACLFSFWLALPVHAAHENASQPVLHENMTTRSSGQSPEQHPYADEFWLIGSFLISVTGVVILVRYLPR